MLSLEHITAYIPQDRIDVEKAGEIFNLTRVQTKIYSKIFGLKSVSVANGLDVTKLIIQPVVKLLEETKVPLDRIKFIIHTHTGGVVAPFGNCSVRQVRDSLGLNASAFGITLNNCASTVTAFEVAAKMLRDLDDDAKAIIITGDRAFTPLLRIIHNVSIMGDASTAVLVSRKREINLVRGITIRTYGKYSEGIWMSKELSFKFEEEYVSMVVDTISEALTATGLNKRDIKLILPHNVNYISWTKTMQALDIPVDRVFLNNVGKYGHCFGADIMINYISATEAGLIQPGDHYIMVTVGLGVTVAVAVIQY